jgi:sulfonate transport system substrate-binding protein
LDYSAGKLLEKNMRLLKLSLSMALMLGVGAARSAEPVKIRVAWQAPMNLGSIPLEKKDLAKHSGKSYVVEPVLYGSSPPMITALAIGELEIAHLSFSTVPIAIQNAGRTGCKAIIPTSTWSLPPDRSGRSTT